MQAIRAVRAPTFDEIVRARDVLSGMGVGGTPVVDAPGLVGDRRVVLKLETLLPGGSFKVRGAVAALTDGCGETSGPSEVGDGGVPVVAASAGNHALGMAWAARRLGMLDRLQVVVATTASAAKREGLRRLGARVVEHGTTYDEAEAHGLELAARIGGRFVSGYNDCGVMAGDGTIGLELAEQFPDLACVVVPAGGGGLVGSIALALSVRRPEVRVVAVEAARSPGLSASVVAGRAVPVEVGPTLADGLAGSLEPGSATVELVSRHVRQIVAVDEDAIAAAMRFSANDCGLVTEGSGAAGVAAVMTGAVALESPEETAEPGPGTTAVVLSGRNVTADVFARVLAGGT